MAKKIACPDCDAPMEYVLSNIHAPNDFRVRVYACKKCQKDTGLVKAVAFVRRFIKAKDGKDFWQQVTVVILQELKNMGG